ncbi:MAG: hypothetical protein ACR2QK_13570 [Acidimicrobiales bacterium]
MGLLNRLSGNRSPKSAVELPRLDRLDPFLADGELRAAYRSLVDGDWKRLERFLDVSPTGWMFGPIVTSEIVGLETVAFERWVEFKRSPRSRAFYAAVQIRDAFSARSQAIASETNGHRLAEDEKFVNRLTAAEEILYEVVSDRPAMADPWIGLLISGRGLQVGLEEIRERFENAHSRAPFRPDACRQYLQSLTKKWNGSNVATFDFARWVEKQAPEGSSAREVLPTAHIEKGLLQEGRTNLATYLMQPEVVAELATGLLSFLQATPSPAPTEALGVLNAYALAISADGQSTARLVTETFARIDNRPTEFPWSIYADDINDVFSEIQADQLRFASRY